MLVYFTLTRQIKGNRGNSGMCMIGIHIQGRDRFFEVFPNEVERAEFTVEESVGEVLFNLFDEVQVDEVTISFSPDLGKGLHNCSIDFRAQCSCDSFTLFPHTREYMEFAIRERVCPLLKELFGSVSVEHVTMAPLPWGYDNDPTLPCRC